MFVLDEADEMLSRGFKEQIYDVFKCMPNDVQVSSVSLIFMFVLGLLSRQFKSEITFLLGSASFGYDAIGSPRSNKSFYE